MGYLAITICAIAVTIWIIYRLANNVFHLGLKLKPLLLCAVCSLFISVIIPKIVVGFAGLAGTLVVLAIVAVIFAYFVAYYDDRDETSKLVPASACIEGTADPLPVMGDTGNSFSDTAEAGVVSNDDIVVSSVNQENSAGKAAEEYSVVDYSYETTGIDEEEKETDIVFDTPLNGDSPNLGEHRLMEVEKALNSFTSVNNLSAELQDDIQELNVPHSEELAVEFIASNSDKAVSTENRQTELIIEDTLSSVEAEVETEVEVEAEVPSDLLLMEDNAQVIGQSEDIMPASLDELLDMAFTFKEQTNNAKALLYFREALKLHPTSEAAPYLIVEIANILKNKGAYDEAIKIFTEGRNLPGLQQDEMLVQEFTDTIAYLRIVRNHLLQRHLGFVPYDKIPSEVFQDIDEEFREWRNLAS